MPDTPEETTDAPLDPAAAASAEIFAAMDGSTLAEAESTEEEDGGEAAGDGEAPAE
ncbi:MAG TPA: hypothetical protein VHW26_06010 [Solirubrobacteraceae bacterium]|jgi:hypothetical protein|nr:hypothetical protein [Solirubrobacteraceae bacterium]